MSVNSGALLRNFHARSGKFGNKWGDGIHKCRFCKGLFQEQEGVAAQSSGGIHAERGDQQTRGCRKGSAFGKLLSVALFTCSPEEPEGGWIRAVLVAIRGGCRVRNGDIKKRAALDVIVVANPNGQRGFIRHTSFLRSLSQKSTTIVYIAQQTTISSKLVFVNAY
jgi:hypothetical protein